MEKYTTSGGSCHTVQRGDGRSHDRKASAAKGGGRGGGWDRDRAWVISRWSFLRARPQRTEAQGQRREGAESKIIGATAPSSTSVPSGLRPRLQDVLPPARPREAQAGTEGLSAGWPGSPQTGPDSFERTREHPHLGPGARQGEPKRKDSAGRAPGFQSLRALRRATAFSE